MDRSMPVGKAARAAVAGVTAAKIGAKKLSLLSKRPFLTRESFEERRAESDDEIAATLFRGLSTLRGSALKLAQAMSLEFGLLPDAYRKELYKSNHQVTPLNRGVVRRLIISEFGRPPEELFEAFETTAFAAASLGQVHRARGRGGEAMAVKVQYPGIGRAISNDLQLVKQLVLPFVQAEYFTKAAAEIEQRLADEIDYDLERRRTEWFHEHGQMDGVVVPRTFAEYSSAHVLTTELMDGLHLEQWLATSPSQQRRDRAAQRIYDFCTRSLAELHTVHADPNPGNYLFRDDGTIAVIDFGSAKTFDPDMGRRVLAHRRAIVHGDITQIIASYAALGAAEGDHRRVEELYRTAFAPLDAWARLPFQGETFDFGKHADYRARGAALYRDIMTHSAMNSYTAEPLLFYRTIYGLYQLFTRLRARVHMKNQWT